MMRAPRRTGCPTLSWFLRTCFGSAGAVPADGRPGSVLDCTKLQYAGLPLGQSFYDSMIFDVVKRAGRGLTMDMNYVWSKTEGDSFSAQQENNGFYTPIQDFGKMSQAAHTITGYDLTNVVKGFASYQLPFGRGQQWLANGSHVMTGIVGGWTWPGPWITSPDSRLLLAQPILTGHCGAISTPSSIPPGANTPTRPNMYHAPRREPARFELLYANDRGQQSRAGRAAAPRSPHQPCAAQDKRTRTSRF